MEREKAAEILKRLEKGYALRPLSAIALKLVEMASEENASMRDMVDLIAKDPSLAVRLLHLANSAAFGGGGRVSNLNFAAMRLGVHRLKILALSISLRDAFPLGRINGFDYGLFWRASLYRALMARSLAEQVKRCDPEEAFVAGLTLEIGLPVLFDLCASGGDSKTELPMEPLEEVLIRERARFGLDHRQIGKAALHYWKFPDQIIACQSTSVSSLENPQAPLLGQLCELARLFSRMLMRTSADFHTFFAAAERLLGLKPDIVQDKVLDTFQQVKEIADVLSLEVNGEKDLMAIMEKANQALIRISQKMSRFSREGISRHLPSMETLDQEEKTVSLTLQAVAHEIRNPLMTVGGFARRLANSLDEESKLKDYTKVILEEAKRLEKILASMK